MQKRRHSRRALAARSRTRESACCLDQQAIPGRRVLHELLQRHPRFRTGWVVKQASKHASHQSNDQIKRASERESEGERAAWLEMTTEHTMT